MRIKDSNILLTGGAGFIGSQVLDELLKRGARVIVIDDFNNYYNIKFKENNLKSARKNKNCEIVKGDITNFELLKKYFQQCKFDLVIHIAARAGVRPSIQNPLLYQKVNVEGTNNLLELCRQYGVKKFMFASSSSVYGNQKKIPFSETDPVNEPISPYAATKRAGELLIYTYHHLFGIDAVILRFFTVYGERGRPDMAPYVFTEKILRGKPIQKFGSGSTKRDYTYIFDIVGGVIRAIEKDLRFEIINLGNNCPITLNEFISEIEKTIGKKAIIENLPAQPGDAEQTYADVAKAKKLLGWEPKTSFRGGIKKFIDWYKDRMNN